MRSHKEGKYYHNYISKCSIMMMHSRYLYLLFCFAWIPMYVFDKVVWWICVDMLIIFYCDKGVIFLNSRISRIY